MRLGVISDTHDRLPMIESAVDYFNDEKVDAVLHCGDFCAPFAILPFKRLKTPFYAVFGNNDGEKEGITRLFADNGWTLNDRPWILELNGHSIAMLHEPAPVNRYAENGDHDLVVFGHTHEKNFVKKENCLIVNPGECCGWIKNISTVALVDLDSGTCEFKLL